MPIRAALIELTPRTAVHRNQLRASPLGAPGELGRIHRMLVPAEPHLHRDGRRNGRHRRVDQAHRMVDVAHERRPRIAVRDPLCRASHVDVNDVGPACLGNARRFADPGRLAAGKLDRVDRKPGAFHP